MDAEPCQITFAQLAEAGMYTNLLLYIFFISIFIVYVHRAIKKRKKRQSGYGSGRLALTPIFKQKV